MAFMHPFDHTYDDYVRLARRLKHDGVEVSASEVEIGSDYCYVSDGPRIILEVDQYGKFGLPDTGGPITGGWATTRPAFRGGTDGVLALADHQEAQLRRRQRKGFRHG